MGRGVTLSLRGAGWILTVTGAALALRLSVSTLQTLHAQATTLGSPSALPLADLVAAVCAAVLGAVVVWLLLVTAVTLVEVLTGRAVPAARALSPTLVRRLVLAGCGLAVATASVAPASAVSLSPDLGSPEGLAGLPLPDRTSGAVASSAGTAVPGGTRRATPDTHRVRSGETLWSIAISLLPEAAELRDVDATWRQVYRANRAAVGDDPDVLAVGTTLRLPAAVTPAPPTPGDEPATHDGKDA